ncbi:MAG: TldD/PmbA family protein [Nitrospirota bacterium]
MDYRDIGAGILKRLLAKGADEAEVYIQLSKGTSIEMKDGEVDSFEGAEEQGIGVRVISEKRVGFSYTTDFSDRALDKLLDEAVRGAVNTEGDSFNSLPSQMDKYEDVKIFDDKVIKTSIKEKIERARLFEECARNYDNRITKVRKAAVDFSASETYLLSSQGITLYQKGTNCSASIMVVAEENGEAQMAWDFASHRFYDDLNVDDVAKGASKKAVGLLGAKRIQSCRAPVILSDSVASEFLGILSSSFSGDAILKNKSILKDKKGERLFSGLINIIDDGLMPGMVGSGMFDGEGVPLQKKVLVEKGVLKGYLHNTITARKMNEKSTGNGMRGGFKGIPNVGITNLFIEKGEKSLDGLISDIKEGIYITEVMGMHTANPISGDFSVGAMGFYIKDGRIAYPVREIAIAGSIFDLFNKIDGVGNDLKFYGKIGSPSLRIAELSVSGK